MCLVDQRRRVEGRLQPLREAIAEGPFRLPLPGEFRRQEGVPDLDVRAFKLDPAGGPLQDGECWGHGRSFTKVDPPRGLPG